MTDMTAPLTTPVFALIGPIGPLELVILGILGVLIFGKRLPEVGRNIGKGIIEFKKGLAGIDENVNKPDNQPPPQLEDQKDDPSENPAG